jgi:hypothetical protein
MGRSDEALQLCEELSERRPSDMPTLYAMLLTFRSNARRMWNPSSEHVN